MSSLNSQFPDKLAPLFEPHRYKVCRGGRGSGKSWGFARALLIQGASEPLRVLCAREVQRSIKDSVHRLLADQIQELGLGHHYEVLQTEIRGRNGTSFAFSGLSNQTIDSIKSFEGVQRCWVEEGQSVGKRSWEILIPTIRAPGSEIWVTFNPDLDTDDTWLRFIENTPADCALMEMNYRDNPWFPQVLEAERLHLQKIDPVAYENVWEGKPRAAAEGAIYAEQMRQLAERGGVRNVPADPKLKTHTIWDVGHIDATAIIFVQRQLSEIRIVDYYEARLGTYVDHANAVKAKGYNLGDAWLPWDADDARFAMIETGPMTILRRAGLSPRIVPKMAVEAGIKNAKLIFPRCYFDAHTTVRLRECLKRYRAHIPVSLGETTGPVHDEFSHGADAFRYLATVADRLTNDSRAEKPLRYDLRGYV